MDELRYPIGMFAHEGEISREQLQEWMADIESTPSRLRDAVAGLSDEQLDTPYRPGGWTLRQVVHHVADSHMNSYTRFKLALTEEDCNRACQGFPYCSAAFPYSLNCLSLFRVPLPSAMMSNDAQHSLPAPSGKWLIAFAPSPQRSPPAKVGGVFLCAHASSPPLDCPTGVSAVASAAEVPPLVV